MLKKINIQRKKKSLNNIFWMFLIGAGLLLIGSAFFLSGLQQTEKVSSAASQYSTIPLVVNYPAPEINLTDLASNKVNLQENQNKIVLVNNWATWCPPCKAEMPTLQAYYEAHKDDGLLIIAIESGESLSEVSDFVKEYAISFPVWIDRNGVALEAFGNWNLPSSYVIDREGMIRLTWTGEISQEMLDKYVTPLLKE